MENKDYKKIVEEALEYICDRFEYIEETGEYYLTHMFDKDNLFELYKILNRDDINEK